MACCKTISLETPAHAVELWNLALKFDSYELRSKVLEYIRLEFMACLAHPGVMEIMLKMPLKYLKAVTSHRDLIFQEKRSLMPSQTS
ncbi:hypothetical protein WJX72_002688 [[Myrmecia] bisecta]|uniref:Uncharacterized protein n=1 Tax=[Myrmecia] bisecta TaxID=41462 RepID=A0AAW1Q7D3_9CHLO